MNDTQVLAFLVRKMKRPSAISKTLKVKPQAITNWRQRGISAAYRPAVWALANKHGAKLSTTWLMPRMN